MGAIYSGFVLPDSYLFITNAVFGKKEHEAAIVRINRFCAAFVVTVDQNLLIRANEALSSILSSLNTGDAGISMGLAEAIVESFKVRFQREPFFRENPLPFLLLLVGYTREKSPRIEHIFIRNRVTEAVKKHGKTEYVTAFEIQSPVPAQNIFYGHFELSNYLSLQLPKNHLSLDAMKVFACLSLMETQNLDGSLFPEIRLATISEENGFEWITEKECRKICDKARKVDRLLSERLKMLHGISKDSIAG